MATRCSLHVSDEVSYPLLILRTDSASLTGLVMALMLTFMAVVSPTTCSALTPVLEGAVVVDPRDVCQTVQDADGGNLIPTYSGHGVEEEMVLLGLGPGVFLC